MPELAADSTRKRALDRAHLARMTGGEAALERELLGLFDAQAELLVARMQTSETQAIAALAHTLKGSAAGIGALEVAEAAAAVEQAANAPARRDALLRLTEAVAAARKEIVAVLCGDSAR